jgi:hypothetical protein
MKLKEINNCLEMDMQIFDSIFLRGVEISIKNINYRIKIGINLKMNLGLWHQAYFNIKNELNETK